MGLRETLEAATPPLLTVEQLDERIADAQHVLDNPSEYDPEAVRDAGKDKRLNEYLRRYAAALREAQEIITEQHGKLWLVGLDRHEGEAAQSEEESIRNLRALLARLDRIGKEQT